MALPFINKYYLTIATFLFLRSTITGYCERRFLFFPEKDR